METDRPSQTQEPSTSTVIAGELGASEPRDIDIDPTTREQTLDVATIPSLSRHVDQVLSPIEQKIAQGQRLSPPDYEAWQTLRSDICRAWAREPESEELHALARRAARVREDDSLLGEEQYLQSLRERSQLLRKQLEEGESPAEKRSELEDELASVSRKLRALEQ